MTDNERRLLIALGRAVAHENVAARGECPFETRLREAFDETRPKGAARTREGRPMTKTEMVTAGLLAAVWGIGFAYCWCLIRRSK